MKRIRFGNALDVKKGIIVHGCNAQGVMGSGIAAEIRSRWPKVFTSYVAFLGDYKRQGESPLGKVDLVEVSTGLWVASAITQDQFGRDPNKRYCSYPAIAEAFQYVAVVADASLATVHYPLIGAGLANGSWAIISEIIDDAFLTYPDVERTLWIYEP